jgi:hypothetical protein
MGTRGTRRLSSSSQRYVSFCRLKYLSSLTITQQDLKNVVSKESPDINVETRVYPKYETRGDLAACVETFREW